jgi:hypothetical protein
MRHLTGLALAALLVTGPVAAQEITLSGWVYRPLGVGDLDGKLPVSAEVRASLPVSGRLQLEPFASVGTSGRSVRYRVGFYGVQVRQQIDRLSRGGTPVFVTYGVASVYSRSAISPPFIGHLGLGARRRLSQFIALRPEVQLITFHVVPIGLRFSIGVSIGRE